MADDIDLAVALRAAHALGYNEGIDNHFSVALDRDRFLLNRYGPDWSEITTDDILTVGVDGTVLAGAGEWMDAAFVIHRAVHLARADARVVLHTHMPWATTVAMTTDGLLTTLSQQAMYFHGRVERLSFDGLAVAEEEGDRIQRCLGTQSDVILMDNHGVLVVGASVAEAWHRLYFLERACQLQVLAQSTNRPLVQVSDEVAERTSRQWREAEAEIAEKLFASLRRRYGADVRVDCFAGTEPTGSPTAIAA